MLIWRTINRTAALTQKLTVRRGKHYKTDNKQGLRRVQRAGAVEDPSPTPLYRRSLQVIKLLRCTVIILIRCSFSLRVTPCCWLT